MGLTRLVFRRVVTLVGCQFFSYNLKFGRYFPIFSYQLFETIFRTHNGTSTPQKNELMAPSIMKNFPATPEVFQSSIIISLNFLLKINSQNPRKYPSNSINSMIQSGSIY
jgi:hypothetical protein